MLQRTGFFLLCLILSLGSFAQNPYVLNGNATQINCHCYTLTTAQLGEVGSIWNKNKIDLTQPFDYAFNVFLGCMDTTGADGMVFVLQPISTSLGTAGEGIGFGGIVPSIGVTIDTYQNFNDDDPPYDHLAIQANGDVEHSSPNNLAGPVRALANSDNIEDCKWHLFRINWQPQKQLLEISMDNALRLSLKKDIISTIFNNNPLVYWGFTAATGDSVNLQQVCTALNPKYVVASHANTCTGTPLRFIDSSVSFGSIINWYWNFGDGTTFNVANPPAHAYDSPGIYNVTLNIKGNDGCLSDTFKEAITVGTYPVADFKIDPLSICSNKNITFLDASTLEFGTENYWSWNFGNGITSKKENPPAQLYKAGIYPVQFIVESTEGCADTIEKNITVAQASSIDFTTSDACKNAAVLFKGIHSNDTITIKQWYWNFGDNSFSDQSTVSHTYLNGGNYNVQLVALDNNGCFSDTISKPIKIYATNAYAGRDTTVFINYPYQLYASGGDTYSWSPATGLNNPLIADPVATLSNDATYILTASTVLGCATKDTLHIKVEKSIAIYAPTAFTPNGDGKNDRFRIITSGIIQLNGFEVFNRWGQRIYYSLNASEGWDGNLKGISQPPGTYLWSASGKAIDGRIIQKQGSLVLIR